MEGSQSGREDESGPAARDRHPDDGTGRDRARRQLAFQALRAEFRHEGQLEQGI